MYSKDYTYVVIGAVLLAVILFLHSHMSTRAEAEATPVNTPVTTEEGDIQDSPEYTQMPKLMGLGDSANHPRWADEVVAFYPTSASNPEDVENPAESTLAPAPEATTASKSTASKQVSEHMMMKMAAAFPNEDYIEEEQMPELTPAPEPKPEPVSTARYASLAPLVEGYRDDLAYLTYHEDRGNGDGAVVEVVFNRFLNPEFPDTIPEVIYQKNPLQFAPSPQLFSLPIDEPEALERCYELIDTVLYEEEYHVPADYCYFNSRDIRTPGPTDYEFGGNVYFK